MSDHFFVDSAFAAPESVDPARLDRLVDGELDQLSFGVIALDEDGIVLRYNQYESRLARLDRNQVLGRNFFSEVAPCTRSADFEGRFQRYVASGARQPERFQYLFDFKFGAQEVQVELVRASDFARYYLLINRTQFRAPRVDGLPAPLQSEFAPDEASAGVLRDASERRIVLLPATFFAGLKATCDHLAPQTWPIFCHEWGVQWGRRAAIDLETQHLEADGASLRELSMLRVAEVLGNWFRLQGLGRLGLDFSYAAKGCLLVELERSALAEANSKPFRAPGSAVGTRACALIAGCLSALFSHLGGRRLTAREFSCSAHGAAHCSFLVVAQVRTGALDTLIDAVPGGYDASTLVERLRSPVGGGPA